MKKIYAFISSKPLFFSVGTLTLILILGASLRLPALADRPMHHDEANQAVRFGILLEEGTYQYDANDHHGPTLYYLTLPLAKIFGQKTFAETTEHTYRLLPALFGLGVILLPLLFRKELGGSFTAVAALLTATSPAMAYYSRFYIQETLLLFFTALTLISLWKTWTQQSKGWAISCGLFAGLMYATKETAIIAFAAMAAPLCLEWMLQPKTERKWKSMGVCLAVAFAAFLFVAILLYSSFFTHPKGPIESVLAYKTYFGRGVGQNTDHIHPWTFYLRMFWHYRFDGGPVWSERLIALPGLLGAGVILLKKLPTGIDAKLARFLLIYTLLLSSVYSLIAYKTPWCILSFLHGWILLAAIGLAALFCWLKRLPKPTLLISLAVILLMAATRHTYQLADRTVYRYAADYRNPYVYAHTAPDFKKLLKRINDLRNLGPDTRQLYIQVIAAPDETWPLPFYLRTNQRTGFWTTASEVPTEPAPDLLITSVTIETDPERYLTEYYGLRADTLLALHIPRPLWERFMETRR
jgi:uncharacterized protein (TIGR03663 family)